MGDELTRKLVAQIVCIAASVYKIIQWQRPHTLTTYTIQLLMFFHIRPKWNMPWTAATIYISALLSMAKLFREIESDPCTETKQLRQKLLWIIERFALFIAQTTYVRCLVFTIQNFQMLIQLLLNGIEKEKKKRRTDSKPIRCRVSFFLYEF